MTARVIASRLLAVLLWHAVVPPSTAQETVAATNPRTVLTNIQQVVALDGDPPAGRYEAHISGVVLFVSPATRRLYVQTENYGVQVNLTQSTAGFRVGQRVDVTGGVIGAKPTLRLAGANATALGETNLPEARAVSPHRLANGEAPFRYVKTRGVVRDMIADRNTLMLLVTYEGLPFELAVVSGGFFLPKEWLDAEIEAQGISYPMYSSSGRATGFRFHVSGTNLVRILSPGISNRFERPLLTIAEAARLPEEWGPRVRIAGTVTVHRPGIALFLDDGTGVMHVDLLHHLATPAGTRHLDHEPQTWLQPGERVEVIGVRHNWFSLTPTLIHAEYRRIGRGPEIQPIEVSFADLRAGRHSGQLVTLEARLIDQRKWSTVKMRYQSLVLRVGDDTFQARWESEVDARWNLKVDSYVRVTGVNDAEGSPSRKGSTFQLLLRSPGDVVPAPAPRFWTRPEVQRVLLGAGGAGLVAAAWILFQRQQMRRLEHRVAGRTADLSGANARLQEEVAARERAEEELRVALAAEKELNQLKSSFVSMVSHEFRTPLEVILSSSHILDRYLDRLPPENRREQLRAIRESVHRMSDLMEDVLMLGKFEAARMTCAPVAMNLTGFCQRCVDEIESATESVCPIRFSTVEVNGEAVGDEGLIGPILTNLLSNAVKYSTPGEPVDFIVTRRGIDAEFVVRDTGCGIPLADQSRLFTAFYRAGNVAHISGSGLGLVIVQRCVELHGGSIQCASEEGKGATFTITLPLFDGTRRFRRNTAPATTQS